MTDGWDADGLPLTVLWRWTVVLPVKGGPRAKSRLGALGDHRPAVAAALATDSLVATLGCPRVVEAVVVTGDPETAAGARRLGATVAPDPGGGLDAAVRAGLDTADPRSASAVLLADVPAMRPADLAAGLDACALALCQGAPSAVVPDLDGDGTVLLAGAYPAAVVPQFGTGSARRHARGGAVVTEVPARLRRDVDQPAQLAVALAMGVGAATARATADLSLPAPA